MRKVPDAIILCGGAGSRLRSIVGDGPKPMARVAGRPFLELLLRQLRRNSFQRVILAVGYRKEVILSYFGDQFCGLHLVYSDEPSPLGTGGALRNATGILESDTVLAMNGDSYIDTDLCRLVIEHHNSKADASLLLGKDPSRNDCGSVLVDKNGWISDFQEKGIPAESAYVNAGVYVLSRSLLLGIPAAVQISIERELFPQWLREKKRLRASLSASDCVDIGTPERYRMAQSSLAQAEQNESSQV